MKIVRFLPAAAALLGTCCSYAARPEPEPAIHAPAELGQDAFALDMFRAVVSEQKGNVVFSPASLENLLDLLKEGARGGTLAALEKLPTGRKGVRSAMQVQSANAIFVADDMKLKPVSVPDVQRVSFLVPEDAARTINAWCSGKTNGLIPSIVTPDAFSADTRMVATNAVYLKEKWLRPFDPGNTVDNAIFFTADKGRARVSMMNRTGQYRYAEGADWQAVALFYAREGRAGEPGCFIGILPKGDARAFAATLTAQKYNEIRSALANAAPEKVQVALPKMEVRTGAFSLDKALKANGLEVMFTPAADFTGFADERLEVDTVMQRCYVKVDEEKTEASAVTVLVMSRSAASPKPIPVIRFDHPFIWAIGDLTTGSAPYFMGLFEKP